MSALVAIALAAAAPAAVSVEHAPYHRVVFATDDYAVLDNLYPPKSDSGFHRHPRDLFYVVISPAKASSQRLGQPLRALPAIKAGSVGMNPTTAEPFIHRVVNADDRPFHVVAVELRSVLYGRPISKRDAASGFTQVHDHPRLRAWRLKLRPGESAPAIAPIGPGVRIFVRPGTLTVRAAGRPDQPLVVAAGDFEQLRPGEASALRNSGPTPIELIDVELK